MEKMKNKNTIARLWKATKHVNCPISYGIAERLTNEWKGVRYPHNKFDWLPF